MGQIGSWNGYTFEVSPSVVRGFTGLTIEGGSETEDKVSNKYAYVQRKNSTPTTVNLEVYLNAYLGCNVRDEAMAFITAATEGAKNYFYINGKKLVTCQLMLVNAKVTETTMTPSGVWTSCRIALTMKQCEKYTGGSSSSSSSSSTSSKSSSKSTTQPKKETVTQQSWIDKTAAPANSAEAKINTVTANAASASNAAKKVASASKVVSAAKSTSTIQKTTTTQKAPVMKTNVLNNKIHAIV